MVLRFFILQLDAAKTNQIIIFSICDTLRLQLTYATRKRSKIVRATTTDKLYEKN